MQSEPTGAGQGLKELGGGAGGGGVGGDNAAGADIGLVPLLVQAASSIAEMHRAIGAWLRRMMFSSNVGAGPGSEGRAQAELTASGVACRCHTPATWPGAGQRVARKLRPWPPDAPSDRVKKHENR